MRTYIAEIVGAVAGMALGLVIGFAVCPENIPALFGLQFGLGTIGVIIGHIVFKPKEPEGRIEYRRTQPPKNPGIVGGKHPSTRPRAFPKNLR